MHVTLGSSAEECKASYKKKANKLALIFHLPVTLQIAAGK